MRTLPDHLRNGLKVIAWDAIRAKGLRGWDIIMPDGGISSGQCFMMRELSPSPSSMRTTGGCWNSAWV